MENLKKAYFVTGLNGAGKSTMRDNSLEYLGSNIVIIDPDKIAKELNCSDIQAGRIAIQTFNDCIKEGSNFLVENTLTSQTSLKQIEKAKVNGFEINCSYVGLCDVDEHILRVQDRVKKGGHNIPTETIKNRFEKSYGNIKNLIPLSDKLDIYDNTDELTLQLSLRKGMVVKMNVTEKWVQERVINHIDLPQVKVEPLNQLKNKKVYSKKW